MAEWPRHWIIQDKWLKWRWWHMSTVIKPKSQGGRLQVLNKFAREFQLTSAYLNLGQPPDYDTYHSPLCDQYWPQGHGGRLRAHEQTVPWLTLGVSVQDHPPLLFQHDFASSAIVWQRHIPDPVRVGEEGWHRGHCVQQPAQELHGHLRQNDKRA